MLLLLLRLKASQSVFEGMASTCQYSHIMPQQIKPTRFHIIPRQACPNTPSPTMLRSVPAEARLWTSVNQTISQTKSEQVSIRRPSLEISRSTKKSLIKDKGVG